MQVEMKSEEFQDYNRAVTIAMYAIVEGKKYIYLTYEGKHIASVLSVKDGAFLINASNGQITRYTQVMVVYKDDDRVGLIAVVNGKLRQLD